MDNEVSKLRYGSKIFIIKDLAARDGLTKKQDTINDLAEIRQNSELAKTALQKEEDPTVPQWAKSPFKPTYTPLEVGALPATVVIPQKTSDLVNDTGFITNAEIANKADRTEMQEAIGQVLAAMAGTAVDTIVEKVNNSQKHTATIRSGRFYKFLNPVTELNLTLATSAGNSLQTYLGKFTAGLNCVVNINPEPSYANGQLHIQPGKTYEFYIVDNIASFTVVGDLGTEAASSFNIVTLAVGTGNLQDAFSLAGLNPNSFFLWMLVTNDNQGHPIKKMIWHIGNGTFIDALGAVITT